MPASPLTLFEREEIRVGIEGGESVRSIAARLGRHRCTVYAELNRNGGARTYCATRAQARADQERSRPKRPKLVADPALAAYVTKRLEAKDSPMTISIELARGTHGTVGSISHETIYQAIYRRSGGLDRGLRRNLHLKRGTRRRRNRTKATAAHSLGDFNPIRSRPAIAAERVEVGHLEGDLIVGANNQSALITLFDRKSRRLWLQSVASKTAAATLESMLVLLRRIPVRFRRTLTWDQGAEIARHKELAKRRHIDIYIADARSPWQRPTNENGNALVRRYVGKGTDLKRFTPRQLRTIENRINTTPRRIHNWASANDIYNHAVAMTN
jgi:IS30 family transposase